MDQKNLKINFLQSKEWREFQKSVGRKTFLIDFENFQASIIEYQLPLVGSYFYIPRGPVISHPEFISGSNGEMLKQVQHDMQGLVELARKEKAGWIRIDPKDQNDLEMIKNNVGVRFIEPKGGFNKLNPYKIVRAPHDMQPKETLILDISKSEEELLSQMKSKTRYNIKLSQKRGVSVKVISNFQFPISNKFSNSNFQIQNDNSKSRKSEAKSYLEDFLRLTKIMAKRQGIATHGDEYYRKMLEIIPEKNIKLYLAEYNGKVIAANLVIFYGDTATYLHGASDDKYKNLMAPYLLQWKQIQDAKKFGCTYYDFFGVKVKDKNGKSWAGITRFKLGFAPNTQTIEFPGSYDIIISPIKYWMYRIMQRLKSLIK